MQITNKNWTQRSPNWIYSKIASYKTGMYITLIMVQEYFGFNGIPLLPKIFVEADNNFTVNRCTSAELTLSDLKGNFKLTFDVCKVI